MEVREENIDGLKVEVIPLPFFKALKLKSDVLKVATPTLKKLFENSGEDLMQSESLDDIDIDISAIGNAITELVTDLDEFKYRSLISQLFASVRINDDDIASSEEKVDHYFTGKFMTFYKVCWFILRSNFSDFLEGNAFGNLQKEVKKTPKATKK